jgi:hypothetical protein
MRNKQALSFFGPSGALTLHFWIFNILAAPVLWSFAQDILNTNAPPALDASQPPGSNFDLSHWSLTLPDAKTTVIRTVALVTGYTDAYFYTGTDGAMVFWCPVIGGTTSNSSYPRSELLELLSPPDADVNWIGYGTNVLTAQCRVLQQPSSGKVVIGQIHSKTGHAYPLLKLQFANGNVEALVKKSPNSDADTKFSFNKVALGEPITYELKMVDGLVSMTVNGVLKSLNVFQTDPDWTNQTLYFKAGAYCQDNSGPSTEGARVAFSRLEVAHLFPPQVPPSIAIQPVGLNVAAGETVTFRVTAEGTPLLRYRWYCDGAALSDGGSVLGAKTAALTLSNVQPPQAGSYTVLVKNLGGSVTSSSAPLAVSLPVALAEALDTPAWVWTTSGSPPWAGQAAVSHDGTAAAQSGAIGNSKTASMQTAVTGPGLVSFWWKVSSETNKDLLRFYVGGKEKARISGEVDWQRQTFSVPSGTQVLKWTYSKNSGKANGQDRAWVDQVQLASKSLVSLAPSLEVARPVPVTLTVTGSKVVLTWPVKPGRAYGLFFKESLADPEWQSAHVEAQVSGAAGTLEERVDGEPQRFYQVLER